MVNDLVILNLEKTYGIKSLIIVETIMLENSAIVNKACGMDVEFNFFYKD